MQLASTQGSTITQVESFGTSSCLKKGRISGRKNQHSQNNRRTGLNLCDSQAWRGTGSVVEGLPLTMVSGFGSGISGSESLLPFFTHQAARPKSNQELEPAQNSTPSNPQPTTFEEPGTLNAQPFSAATAVGRSKPQTHFFLFFLTLKSRAE